MKKAILYRKERAWHPLFLLQIVGVILQNLALTRKLAAPFIPALERVVVRSG